jgi:flagellar hook-associated protein 1 FlgK
MPWVKVAVAMKGDVNTIEILEAPLSDGIDLNTWKAGSMIVPSAKTAENPTGFTVVKTGDGSVNGLQSMLSEVDDYTEKIDALASGMAALINKVHSNDGEGMAFFVGQADGQITAASIRVNSDLRDKPELIAAGKSGAADAPIGDGSRALAIAALRDVSLNAADYDAATMTFKTTTGDTADARYRATIAGLGVDAAYSRTMADNETSLLNQLHQRRESVMGVSIDEEISALVKFQTGYQANARVMTTLTSMLDTLINMVR